MIQALIRLSFTLEEAWYSIWVVTDGTTTGLKAIKGSTAPSGYTAERRIGWIRIDSSLQVKILPALEALVLLIFVLIQKVPIVSQRHLQQVV